MNKEKLFNLARRELASKYRTKKDQEEWLGRILLVCSFLLFFGLGLEFKLFEWLTAWTTCPTWQLISFIGGLGLIGWVLQGVWSYLTTYRLERECGLSNQNLVAWFKDRLKILPLTLIFSIAGAQLTVSLIKAWPHSWWIPMTIICAVFTVLMMFIVPVVFMPMFYKLRPYPNNELRQRLESLFLRAGIKVTNIYEINFSARTNRANAMVTGFGQTRRIILGDTLRDRYTDEEVEGIMAHEIGHHIHRDITTLTLMSIVAIFVAALVTALIWPTLVAFRGYAELASLEGLPLLAVVAGVITWLLAPLSNWISRCMERRCDRFALNLIAKPEPLASAFAKLADDNLSLLYYKGYNLLFEATHPSIGDRIEMALKWKKD